MWVDERVSDIQSTCIFEYMFCSMYSKKWAIQVIETDYEMCPNDYTVMVVVPPTQQPPCLDWSTNTTFELQKFTYKSHIEKWWFD